MQDNFKVGDFIEWKKTFTLVDVQKFAEISGDVNPVHLDADFAASTQFGQPIVHGMLVASLFSAIIANELPGPGTIYLHQSLDFKAPVYHNSEVMARVEIIHIRADKPIFELSTICRNADGKILIEGKAIVIKK